MNHTSRIAVVATLALAGCIGADVEVEILGDDLARMTGTFEMQRALFDMADAEDDFCDPADGGTLELTAERALCRFDRTGSFSELFEDGEDTDMQAFFEPLGNDVVRVTIPMDDMNDEMDEMFEDPAMVAMFRPMLEGYSIGFTVTGVEIISSTGDISEDGRSASFTLPLVSVLEPGFDPPEAFVTEVRY